MKEFTSAVEDVVAEDERNEKIESLLAERNEDGSPKYTRTEAETMADGGKVVEFKVDGRVLKAHSPHDGQLVFMLASMGRGQTNDSRFASIVNIMMESLHEPDDKDYLESRLLTSDPKKRLSLKVVEGIFEYLTEEWFRPEAAEDRTPVRAGG